MSLFLVPLSPKHNIYGGTITRLWFVVGRNGTAIGESAGKTQWEVLIAAYP